MFYVWISKSAFYSSRRVGITMTLRQLNTEKLALSSIIVVVMTIGVAYATSVYQVSPWADYGGIPNGWSGTQRYGFANTYGEGEIYAQSTGFEGTTNANAWHNYNTSTGSAGTEPRITTSASTVYFGADVSYALEITKGTFGTAQYKSGANLYRINSGNTLFQKTCVISAITTSGIKTGSAAVYCNNGGYAGTNTFATVGLHDVYTTTPWSGTNRVDAKNGAYETTTSELVLCDVNCGNT